jgi:hypothetical protein
MVALFAAAGAADPGPKGPKGPKKFKGFKKDHHGWVQPAGLVPLEVVPPDPVPEVVPPPRPGRAGGFAAPAARYPTLAEFAGSFRPLPGTYEVTLIHPRTCCPVTICFTLPHGCPKVKVNRDELRFDYGRYEVDIEFKKKGRVKIEYQD